jgi:hypothetical protein
MTRPITDLLALREGITPGPWEVFNSFECVYVVTRNRAKTDPAIAAVVGPRDDYDARAIAMLAARVKKDQQL